MAESAARPVALLNSLRFGSLDDPLIRRTMAGVVRDAQQSGRGGAGPAHSLLDRLRRVREARNARHPGREQHGAPCLPDRERGPHVLAEEEVLDRQGGRLVLGDQVAYARVDVGQPPLQRSAGTGLDHAAVERRERAAARDHHPVARVRGARVDA